MMNPISYFVFINVFLISLYFNKVHADLTRVNGLTGILAELVEDLDTNVENFDVTFRTTRNFTHFTVLDNRGLGSLDQYSSYTFNHESATIIQTEGKIYNLPLHPKYASPSIAEVLSEIDRLQDGLFDRKNLIDIRPLDVTLKDYVLPSIVATFDTRYRRIKAFFTKDGDNVLVYHEFTLDQIDDTIYTAPVSAPLNIRVGAKSVAYDIRTDKTQPSLMGNALFGSTVPPVYLIVNEPNIHRFNYDFNEDAYCLRLDDITVCDHDTEINYLGFKLDKPSILTHQNNTLFITNRVKKMFDNLTTTTYETNYRNGHFRFKENKKEFLINIYPDIDDPVVKFSARDDLPATISLFSALSHKGPRPYAFDKSMVVYQFTLSYLMQYICGENINCYNPKTKNVARSIALYFAASLELEFGYFDVSTIGTWLSTSISNFFSLYPNLQNKSNIDNKHAQVLFDIFLAYGYEVNRDNHGDAKLHENNVQDMMRLILSAVNLLPNEPEFLDLILAMQEISEIEFNKKFTNAIGEAGSFYFKDDVNLFLKPSGKSILKLVKEQHTEFKFFLNRTLKHIRSIYQTFRYYSHIGENFIPGTIEYFFFPTLIVEYKDYAAYRTVSNVYYKIGKIFDSFTINGSDSKAKERKSHQLSDLEATKEKLQKSFTTDDDNNLNLEELDKKLAEYGTVSENEVSLPTNEFTRLKIDDKNSNNYGNQEKYRFLYTESLNPITSSLTIRFVSKFNWLDHLKDHLKSIEDSEREAHKKKYKGKAKFDFSFEESDDED